MSSKTHAPSQWTIRFGERHRLQRITDYPLGIAPPKRVRIYLRRDHYVLQWWDPGQKTNLSDRVDGDLVAAIVRARAIDERLNHFCSAGRATNRRFDHQSLVQHYVEDLRRRSDAGEIDPATGTRYENALRHYLAFCEQPAIRQAYPYAASVNREFRLAFAAFLAQRQITGNGHSAARGRKMKGQSYVLDTVRSLFMWAADGERGNMLPDGFRNPFLGRHRASDAVRGDDLTEPDITIPMTIRFLQACDAFQLRLFVPVILFGLRAAEPCFVFREHIDAQWLAVRCIPQLHYATKGRRDKRLPLIEELNSFWEALRSGAERGLLFERRSVVEGRCCVPLRGCSLDELANEYRCRCAAARGLTAASRHRLRDHLLHDAGGLNYDQIEQEFHSVARRLKWPAAATLKDFRHSFATMLGNSPMSEAYRKYLMGHAPDKGAINAYTHLNQLSEQFRQAVRLSWAELIATINAATLASASIKSRVA